MRPVRQPWSTWVAHQESSSSCPLIPFSEVSEDGEWDEDGGGGK